MNRIVLVFIFLFTFYEGISQTVLFEQKVAFNDSINYYGAREKIFVHYDRYTYKVNDTLWLKGYILEAADHTNTDSSRLAYVDFFNSENKLVKRISLVSFFGLFTGNIILSENEFKQGEYEIRSYTRHMMNHGDSLFFKSRFRVIDLREKNWQTVVRSLKLSEGRLHFSASVKDNDKQNIAYQTLNVGLLSGNKKLYSQNVTTNGSGSFLIDTLLGNLEGSNLVIEIKNKKNLDVKIPVSFANRDLDIQFLPEGGHWVAGIRQRIAFKALNASGKGVDVNGIVYDDRDSVVTQFNSIHDGMGFFFIVPSANKQYTAKIDNHKPIDLPKVENSGITLSIINERQMDSLEVNINGTTDKKDSYVYFTATTRGLTYARGRILFSGKEHVLRISKKQFPSGVTVFTLYDENYIPTNSRAVFMWNNDDLKITLSPDKAAYGKKDSVNLLLKVKNQNQQPVRGNFSIAVIDTNQVRFEPERENLLSYIVLSSDVRGTIENPNYYFKDTNNAATEALMLTQGWIGYEPIKTPFTFKYEKEYDLSGRVTSLSNRVLPQTVLSLSAKAGKGNNFYLDTLTDNNGRFTFNGFPFYNTDSVSMIIRALNKKGNIENVNVELFNKEFPEYSSPRNVFLNKNIILDTMFQQFAANQMKIREWLKKESYLLDEVVVKSIIRIPGSQNRNKDGGADQTITENTLNEGPRQTLLEVLSKQVKGFHPGTLPKTFVRRYMVNGNIARFIIDGMDLNYFYEENTDPTDITYNQNIDFYLTYFQASDIKGIEIMNTPSYNSTYRNFYLEPEELMAGRVVRDYSFIEITTKSGMGPFMKKSPSGYLVRPLFPFVSRQFYSPRYTSSDQQNPVPDMRATIYWNPQIVTNEKGESTISFFTSESNSSYMVLIQGTDLNGGLGVGISSLIIKE